MVERNALFFHLDRFAEELAERYMDELGHLSRTQDPDLTGVTLSESAPTTDRFGNPVAGTFRATYAFDEPVSTTTAEAEFFLYLADGTRLIATDDSCTTGATTTGTGQNNNTVTCTAYRVDADNSGVLDGGEVTATLSTSAQIGSATLGTVDNGAVTALAGGDANPEGAAFTTGGTGTRTA